MPKVNYTLPKVDSTLPKVNSTLPGHSFEALCYKIGGIIPEPYKLNAAGNTRQTSLVGW